jgi:crotonobetainyl-CoA:carnitine CoA-transferase CaiB-like acyl-CoA transferase
MWLRGSADREPLQVGGRVGEWIGASYAAVAALACVRTARASGRGDHADISLFECIAVTMHASAINRLAALDPVALGGRQLDSPGIAMTSDGTYVGLTVITGQQYLDLFVLIERPDLMEEWGAQRDARFVHRDEVRQLVEEWIGKHTTEAVLERAALLRVPASVVGTPDRIPEFDHFVESHQYSHNPRGFLQPRPPFRVDDAGLRPGGPAPTFGEMKAGEPWPDRRGRSGRAAGPDGPLSGVRIVDLTAFLAGPSCTHLLAGLGADVIKVEAIQRPDPIRFFSERPSSEDLWWEWGPTFNYVNTNKRDVTLDLGAPVGRALLDRLLSGADVLVENFTPRVMDSFDLGRERLRADFPQLTVVRMPAFGLTGPWRDHPGYAHTIEQASGMAWLTGYGDSPPVAPAGPADTLVGIHAAFAAMAALEDSANGGGRSIEVPMVEVGLNVAAELVIERSGNGTLMQRQGNRGPYAAPQGVYRCSGPDRWLGVAVETDEQWRLLRTLLGEPAWTRSASLDHEAGRRADHDMIDIELGRWCADANADELAQILTEAGVPAAVVCTPEEVANCPQTQARGFIELEDHPVSGRRPMPGLPLRLRSQPGGWIRTPAPLLGEHNHEVFGGLLGLTTEDVAELYNHKLAGTRPLGL